MLTYLMPLNPTDQPIDLMDDSEYVCDLTLTEDEVMESLDDAILARYREIWS